LAVVTVQLVDGDVFDLDDTVATVLPEAPVQWRAVTVKHLLTHTSGLPHWCELPGFDPSIAMDAQQRLAPLLEASLLSEPGAMWRYSSPGYMVLSAVLARAARRPYADLARELIMDKLALDGTTILTEPTGEVARGYCDGRPPWDLSSVPGTGDVWSTAVDVAAFITAVHNGALLSVRAHEVLRERASR
jgi:Beta-lactamase class C and other penicillin binding proteins